jgi:polyphosphate kinase 2
MTKPMSTAPLQFDLDDPVLPKPIRKAALTSGGFPYDEEMDDDHYESELRRLHLQLALLQNHMLASGGRLLLVFEGRDAAGKGGAIQRYTENLNPRNNIVVALPKPSDREATQWYFQRYVDWLPAAGETVLFDRSWYNRAGVEPVMGYCTKAQTATFLTTVPRFERMLVEDGIILIKFFLDIGREMQQVRFHERRHDPLKLWKIGPVDLAALDKWEEYSAARDVMLKATDSKHAPWTVVRANDKRRTRLAVLGSVLRRADFDGKDLKAIGPIDDRIVMGGEAYLDSKRD